MKEKRNINLSFNESIVRLERWLIQIKLINILTRYYRLNNSQIPMILLTNQFKHYSNKQFISNPNKHSSNKFMCEQQKLA